MAEERLPFSERIEQWEKTLGSKKSNLIIIATVLGLAVILFLTIRFLL